MNIDNGGSVIVGEQDRLTEAHLTLVNSVMGARCPYDVWMPFFDCVLPELQKLPAQIDLIEASDREIEPALKTLRSLITRLTTTPRLTDMSASKMLHLLRPRFIAISDSLVRARLNLLDRKVGSWRPNQRGQWFASRLVLLQQRVRQLAHANSAVLDELHEWANNKLPAIQVQSGPWQPWAASAYIGMTVPVKLSKVRIMDILLFGDEAIHGAKPDRTWLLWYKNR